MKLWMLRHAPALIAPGHCYGRTDLAADADATEAAAQRIAPLLPRELPIRVSRLSRARQLADAVLRRRPDLPAPIEDAGLDEMDFGHFEGVPWEQIPRTAFDAWSADFANHRFGGKESAQEVIDRVARSLETCRQTWPRREQGDGLERQEGLWITHAGVMRAVQFIASRGDTGPIQAASEWPREAPAPGHWTEVDLA
jgi:alpha-ribazole phosphatase